MKIGPILMSPEMVLANLSGLKTETRRVIKDQPDLDSGIGGGVCDPHGLSDHPYCWRSGFDGSIVRPFKKPPTHLPGDKLYVREAWRASRSLDDVAPRDLTPNHIYMTEADEKVHLRQKDSPLVRTTINSFTGSLGKFRQGMHMPRWASRMYLEVKEVHIERLHQITPDGCRAEGHKQSSEDFSQEAHDSAAMDWYIDLWDSLNKERGFNWETNPWVSVTKYNVVMGNIDEVLA